MPMINEPEIIDNYFKSDDAVSKVISKIRTIYKRGLSKVGTIVPSKEIGLR